MADILIRGVEMPDGCHNCGFSYFDKGKTNGGELCIVLMCSIINQGTNGADYNGNRPSWCPLLPLPEGHGRLIDADEFKAYCLAATKEAKPDFIRHEDWIRACAVTLSFCRDIDDAPTIVPAEGGSDDVRCL